MTNSYNDFIDDAYVPTQQPQKKEYATRLKLDYSAGPIAIRIAPPIGELRAKGVWSQARQYHFIAATKKDGTIGKRLVECVERAAWKDDPANPSKKLKTITQHCPICERYNSSKQKLKDHESGQITLTEEELALANADKTIGATRSFDVIAKTRDGKWGYAFLKPDVHKSIRFLIDDLLKNEVDPLGVSGGVWFNITRSGTTFMNTTYSVTPLQSKGTIIPAPLTEDDIQQLKKFDPLNKQKVELMVHQLQQLVDTDMDPNVARTLLSQPVRESAPRPRPPSAPQPLPPTPNQVSRASSAPAPKTDKSLDDFLEDL